MNFDFLSSVLSVRLVVAALTVTWNGAAKWANVDDCFWTFASYARCRNVTQKPSVNKVFSSSGRHGVGYRTNPICSKFTPFT